MITFEGFRPEDGVPIYLQIIKYLKQGIVSGAVADGDELPSRRVLSATLGVNPNTVQKACRMLEEEGLPRGGQELRVRHARAAGEGARGAHPLGRAGRGVGLPAHGRAAGGGAGACDARI